MTNTTKCIMFFAFGAVIGAVGANVLLKKKYEKMANEEMQALRELYHEKAVSHDKFVTPEKRPISDYTELLKHNGYLYSDGEEVKEDEIETEKEEKEEEKNEGENEVEEEDEEKEEMGYTIDETYNPDDDLFVYPYEITVEEFGDLDDYQTDTLIYYADGYVTDEYGKNIRDDFAIDMIGENVYNRLGLTDEDSIFVRNEELGVDYEVIITKGLFKPLLSDDD